MSSMRCKRVSFRGYKRLPDTSTNVTPRLLVFIGPNEAGNSSLLTGLEWLTEFVSDDGEIESTPLEPLDTGRTKRVTDGSIVGPSTSLTPASARTSKHSASRRSPAASRCGSRGTGPQRCLRPATLSPSRTGAIHRGRRSAREVGPPARSSDRDGDRAARRR